MSRRCGGIVVPFPRTVMSHWPDWVKMCEVVDQKHITINTYHVHTPEVCQSTLLQDFWDPVTTCEDQKRGQRG